MSHDMRRCSFRLQGGIEFNFIRFSEYLLNHVPHNDGSVSRSTAQHAIICDAQTRHKLVVSLIYGNALAGQYIPGPDCPVI
jgi:hypothetical protein